MATSEEPLIYTFTKVAIKFQNRSFLKCFGPAPTLWDEYTSRLYILSSKEYLKLTPWILQQFIGVILYGMIFSLWDLTYAENASIVNYFIFGAVLTMSIFTIGAGSKIYFSWKEMTVAGVNALLRYQCNLCKVYRADWNIIEAKWRERIQIIGIGVCASSVGMLAAFGIAYFSIGFKFDLTYFVFGGETEISKKHFVVQILILGLRILTVCCFSVCTIRILGLLLVYFVLVCQAYIGCWELFPEITDFRRMLNEYRKLAIIHTRVNPFANRLVALIMFLGHTCGTSMCWVGIRGWGYANDSVISLFAFFGPLTFIWIIGIITVFSRIHNKVESVTHGMNGRMIYQKGRGKRLEYQRCIKAIPQMSFKCGNFFAITQDSPGNFLMTAVDNLTSAVLTF